MINNNNQRERESPLPSPSATVAAGVLTAEEFDDLAPAVQAGIEAEAPRLIGRYGEDFLVRERARLRDELLSVL